MASFLRLLVLSLLFSLALPAAANEKLGKDELDAQKELLQLKIDSSRELLQKDVDSLKSRIDALDKRLDDQNNRVGDIGMIMGGTGLLVTVLLAFGGLVGYFSVTRQAKEEAKTASRKWFDSNHEDLLVQIDELKKKAAQGHQAIEHSVNEVVQKRDAAITQMQEGMKTPGEDSATINSDEEAALRQSAEDIRAKPEASYSYDDWNTRAFDAYHAKQYEDAALYWKHASSIPNAGAAKSAQALFNRAITLDQLKRYAEACTTYKQLIDTYSSDNTPAIREQVSKAMLNMGVAREQMQQLDEAIATYQQLVATYSSDTAPAIREKVVMAIFNTGITLQKIQKPGEEIATYQQLITTYASDTTPAIREQVAMAMLNMGFVLGQMQKQDEAIATYQQLIDSYSSDSTPPIREHVAMAMVNIGISLGQMQKQDEAIATYQQMIDTYSFDTSPAIREQVAIAFNGKGFAALMRAKNTWQNREQAQSLLRDAQNDLLASLERRTDCGMTRANLAYAQWLLGEAQAAEDSFRSALAATENGGEWLYNATQTDIELHTIPEDQGFRAMVERLWAEHQAAKSSED